MTHGLRRAALSLGAANAIDYALQFLLPVFLARILDTTEFGSYRLLWVVTTTALALTTLGIPQSLYYFLPRSDAGRKRLFIFQALVFLGVGGLLASAAVLPGSPLLPESANLLGQFGRLLSAFVFLWIVSSLLDFLPAADGRSAWQAKTIVGLSILRTIFLLTSAIVSESLIGVIWGMLLFVGFKASLLFGYTIRYHGLEGPYIKKAAFREQTRYAIPFGVAGMLFVLRSQAEQWVVAALFTIGQFAAFSVASVLSPLVSLFRQSMNQAFLPRMSELHAEGNTAAMLTLNNRANVALALFIFPGLAFAFVFASELISLIYTQAYAQGADAMRVYVLGMVAFCVEVNNVMLLLKEGGFAARANFVTLLVCIATSLVFANVFGLAGAAMGSVVAVYIERLLTLRRMGTRLSLPLGALQNWRALGKTVLAAAAAAAIAGWAVDGLSHPTPLALRLALGGGILVVAYLLMLLALGMSPSLRELIRRPR